MDTRKITEGALMSALQLALGFILIASGIGYGFYVDLLLPVTMALIQLKCGTRVGILAGLNTCLILAVGFGNIGLAIYAIQALGFGLLTGGILNRKQSVQDDLVMESLCGCLFLLGLDFLTARVVGVSLLDYDGIDEIIQSFWPQASTGMIEVIYYASIASVPVASVLMTYIGSLILGRRLGYLKGTPYEKYYFITHYKELVPFAYHRLKTVYYGVFTLIVEWILWPRVTWPYLRAFIASSGIILLYFVLTDLVKLIGQYILLKGKRGIWLPVYHVILFMAFLNAFQLTCCLVIVVGSIIDGLTNIRKEQAKRLAIYTQHKIKMV